MSWLLHYSLYVLEAVLPQLYLQHYSLLVTAMHMLSSDNISNENLRSADEMLQHFYLEYGRMYGKHHMHAAMIIKISQHGSI